MTNRNLARLLAAAFAAGASASAAAQTVKATPGNLALTYDSAAETVKTITVVSRMPNGTAELDYYLTVGPVSSLRVFSSASVPDTLDFQVFDAASAPRNAVLSASEAVSASDVLAGTFSDANKQRRATDTLYLAALPGGFASAGTYRATIAVNLYSGPFGGGTFVASDTVAATLTVAEILDVCVVPVGAPFDYTATAALFDFEVLEVGDEHSADLIARANTGYNVSVSSSNGGLLRNADPSDGSTVPYSLSVDGSALPLPAGVSVPLVSGAARTTEAGRRFRLSARILAFDFPSDGSYADTLTVSIVKN